MNEFCKTGNKAEAAATACLFWWQRELTHVVQKAVWLNSRWFFLN